jgi:ATP-dependent exoDNAse (exonuclease V) beta subunit
MAERIRAFAYCEWLTDSDELRKWLEIVKLDHFRSGRFVTNDYISKLRGKHKTEDLSIIFSDNAVRRALATDFDWLVEGMKAQYKNLRSTDYAIKVVKKNGEKCLEQTPQIVVGTVHSVKGGQADVVYVFPDLSTAADDEWMGSEEGRAGIYRVFYVAMTRAREELVLCGPSKQGRAVDFPLAR